MGLRDRLLTPTWFLAWVSLVNMLLNMGTGLIPSVFSSLQRRYGYSSTQLAAIVSVPEFLGLLVAVPVGYYGARRHKARWLTIGCAITACGFLGFALPYFLTPKYAPVAPANSPGAGAANTLCTPGATDRQYVSCAHRLIARRVHCSSKQFIVVRVSGRGMV